MGSTISGTPSTGRCTLAQSRAVFTAIKMLSVPPEVMLPTVFSSPPKRSAVMAITSVSNLRRLGKAVGFSPFSEKKVVYASFTKSLISSPAWKTRLKAWPSRHRTSRCRASRMAASTVSLSLPASGRPFKLFTFRSFVLHTFPSNHQIQR